MDLENGDKQRQEALQLPPGSRGKGNGKGNDKGGARSKRGRKGADGSEETMQIQPMKAASKELMKLYKKAEIAKQDYNAAAKGVAERSNVNTSTLKKLVASSANGKYNDALRMIEQQQVVFEMVGEIPGGSVTESVGE